MRREVTIQRGLLDAKALTHRSDDVDSPPRYRKRWLMLLALGTIPLSLLFVWGFLHLILILVFP